MSEIAERIQALREPAPEAAPEAPPAAAEAPPAPVKADSATQPPPEAEEAPEAPVEAEAEASDVEAIEVETLDDLAEHFGLDKADLYNLRIPIDNEGKSELVSLGEWKDSYVASQRARAEAQKAAEQRAAYEQRQKQMEQQWEQRISDTAATLNVAESQLSQDFQSTNWDELRQTDPAEWAARRQLFQERNAALQNAKRELAQTWESQKAEQAKQAEQQRAEILETERQALLKALPQWADEDAAKSERAELATYLAANGFSEDEVSAVADHRLVVLSRKAMLYDKQMQSADAARKRVVRIGKRTVSPGTTRGKTAAREDRQSALKTALKKSGRVEDAASLISAIRRG